MRDGAWDWTAALIDGEGEGASKADAPPRDRALMRRINDMIFESLSPGGPRPTAFFCECQDVACFKPVWLPLDDYAQLRVDPSWVSLADQHRAGGSRPPVA